MKKKTWLTSLLGAAALMTASVSAHAVPTTWDFTGNGGYLSNPANFASDGAAGAVTVQGFVYQALPLPGSTSSAANLYQSSGGIGVDWDGPSNVTAGCGFLCFTGFADGEELDNNGGYEWLVITLPTAANWTPISLGLSSFDPGFLNTPFFRDDILVMGSNGALNDFGALEAIDYDIFNSDVVFDANGSTFQSLYIAAGVGFFDSILGDSFNVKNLVGDTVAAAAVPEPGTLALLGLGMLGLGVARRRKAA